MKRIVNSKAETFLHGCLPTAVDDALHGSCYATLCCWSRALTAFSCLCSTHAAVSNLTNFSVQIHKPQISGLAVHDVYKHE